MSLTEREIEHDKGAVDGLYLVLLGAYCLFRWVLLWNTRDLT